MNSRSITFTISPGWAGSPTWEISDKQRNAIADKKRERENAERAAAFWEMLAPSKAKLYNFIRKSLDFSVESDDVYQETILRAF